MSLFAAGQWRAFKTARKHRNYAVITLLLSVGVMSLTLDAISAKFFWISLLIAILSFGDSKGSYQAQAE